MTSDDELDEYLKRLLPGVKFISHPRASGLIWAMSPMIDLPTVSDREVEIYMQKHWEEYPPLLGTPLGEINKKEAFSEEHKRFLMEIINHPYEASTSYYKALNLSASAGNRIKAQLESMQLIRLHKIQTGRRGGIPEAIEILPAGYEKLGIAPQHLQGKGGFIHAWWIGRIAKKMADKKTVIEKVLNGKAVDLGVETVDGWIAYEVQLNLKESLITDLITKDISGFYHVTICVANHEDSLRVKKIVVEMKVEDRVAVQLLSEFY